jgi:polyhydroxybutyrate depolymerase
MFAFPGKQVASRVGSFVLAFSMFVACGGGGPEEVGLAEAPVSTVRREVVQVGALERSFLLHVPERAAPGAPAVLVFHGAGGTGARIRGFVGRELETRAGFEGFLVAYLDGYEGTWNDCRTETPYPARRDGVDDVSFVTAVVDHLRDLVGIDRDRVRAIGFSNGGHLVFRLVLEAPGLIGAAAVIGAALPDPSGSSCHDARRPVSLLLMNGTSDPVNPFEGGEVIGPGGESLGAVRSSYETVRLFASRAGHLGEPQRVPVLRRDAFTLAPVERLAWFGVGTPEVNLFTIVGGGHTIPGSAEPLPAHLGHTETRFSAVEEIVRFFDRQPSARDVEGDAARSAP